MLPSFQDRSSWWGRSSSSSTIEYWLEKQKWCEESVSCEAKSTAEKYLPPSWFLNRDFWILTLLWSRSWFPATRWVSSVGLPSGSATYKAEITWTLETRTEPFWFSPEGKVLFNISKRSWGTVWVLYLHEILVSGLAELDEVGLDAVHSLVDFSVVCCLFLEIFLQSALAVNNFTYPWF